MRVHDGFANGQTKSGASVGAGAGFVSAVKALEDVRDFLRGNSHAGVGNLEHSGAVFGAGADADFAVRLVIVNGVGDEVGDDLAEVVGVAESFSGREIAVDLESALPGERTEAFDGVASGFCRDRAAHAVLVPGCRRAGRVRAGTR